MGRQRPWRFSLPLGVSDPWQMCELALEMHMTLGELSYGRGTPMSNYELCVVWPAFFAERARLQQIEIAKQEQRRGAR